MITIPIAGNEWTIKTDPNEYGGGFSGRKMEIEIGTQIEGMVLTIFLHEVLESIMSERCCRYTLYSEQTNDGVMFVFTHKEFEGIIRDLTAALKDVIDLSKLLGENNATCTEATKENQGRSLDAATGEDEETEPVKDRCVKKQTEEEIKEEVKRRFFEKLERHCMASLLENCED